MTNKQRLAPCYKKQRSSLSQQAESLNKMESIVADTETLMQAWKTTAGIYLKAVGNAPDLMLLTWGLAV